jgi:inosine/xanthosine triphosphate pyrophosphatase family protein
MDFGFDEIFELENGKTYAEIGMKSKNELSPRRQALDEIKKRLSEVI